ncbi:MAG: hypothetical protein DRN19_03225 [Thermoplasmata archaeon]|nr:MAG: hypothetical protein DRN19_03225 [Thermoplasmata archaeon]
MNQIWNRDFYRVRKKVLTIGNKYWIEDGDGNVIGFTKQKLLKLKEDIRVYTDESMSQEIFRIQQEQIMDVWGKFAVIDSASDRILGYIKRRALKSGFLWDEWEVYDANENLMGRVEESKGLGLVRKYVPGGAIVPEKMKVKVDGREVAEINQKFKIIGDIWELRCKDLPEDFDRRVLLAGLILMAMIEREMK